MSPPRPPFTPHLHNLVLRALYRQGVRWAVAQQALTRWTAGQDVAAIPCAEEAKGKEYGLETLCRCEGCTLRKCFGFFEQVRTNFGIGA